MTFNFRKFVSIWTAFLAVSCGTKPTASTSTSEKNNERGPEAEDSLALLDQTVYPISLIVNGKNASTSIPRVIIGQRVTIAPVMIPPDPQTTWAWTIGDQEATVKSYKVDRDRTLAPTKLAAADLTGSSVSYYYVKPGTQTVSVRIASAGKIYVGTASISVVGPKFSDFDGTITSLVPIAAARDEGWGAKVLRLGRVEPLISASDGLLANANVVSKLPEGGDIGVIQLIKNEEKWATNLYSGESNTNGKYILDDGLNEVFYTRKALTTYPSNGIQPDGTPANPDGYKNTLVLSDSPGSPLGLSTWYYRNDLFKAYVMYLPPGVDSIWVPIGLMEWNWQGEVRWDFIWTTELSFPESGHVFKGAASSEFPTWDLSWTKFINPPPPKQVPSTSFPVLVPAP